MPEVKQFFMEVFVQSNGHISVCYSNVISREINLYWILNVVGCELHCDARLNITVKTL